MNKDLTDKELLAMGKKTPKVKKRTLFKDYAVKYINLKVTSKDSKLMKKELPAIAKRGAELVMKSILKSTTLPKKLPDHECPFLTVIIYAGIEDSLGGQYRYIYPSALADQHIEEV